MSWGTAEGDKSIRAAITDIEGTSSVEVVVAVRAHARLFLVQHIVVGLIAMIAVLVYAVLNEWDAWAIIALPLGAGVISTLLVEYVPPLYRFLVPAWVRERHVTEAARALFVEKGVHTTRDRTGLLVFVAVRARAVEVIGDVGIVEQLGQTRLDHMAQALKTALPQGPAAVGRTLANFGPELADVFPKKADDTNELPDEPIAVKSE
jgi:putative membrane protein